uniref:Uncharacterized protein n=1 Tax=Arundo donax TaxID=35708 RepID=A0A0A9D3R4_ARUDO
MLISIFTLFVQVNMKEAMLQNFSSIYLSTDALDNLGCKFYKVDKKLVNEGRIMERYNIILPNMIFKMLLLSLMLIYKRLRSN